jgi:hypothetical protein
MEDSKQIFEKLRKSGITYEQCNSIMELVFFCMKSVNQPENFKESK